MPRTRENLHRLSDLRHLAQRYGVMMARHVLPLVGTTSPSLASQLSISIAHTQAAAADLEALIAQANGANDRTWRTLVRLIEYQAHLLAKAILAQTGWEQRFLPLAARNSATPHTWRGIAEQIAEDLGPVDRVCLLRPALPAVQLHERFTRAARYVANRPARPDAVRNAGGAGATPDPHMK